MILCSLLVSVFLVISTSVSNLAHADHNVYLPMAGQTWMAQIIKSTQEQVWCVDARAAAYPNFVAQLRDVNDQYTARVGIRNRQVDASITLSDTEEQKVQKARAVGCQLIHTMPDVFPCGSGAAACIYYANSPVVVAYSYTLGYFDWRSAQGHELGHGILGQLHEQYHDSGGQIACTFRTDTVMDCGSQVRYPQPLDIQRGCAIIGTSWCGQQALPPECGSPCWRDGQFHFDDGWALTINDGCGDWYNPEGVWTYGGCDGSWNGRYVPLLSTPDRPVWLIRGTPFWAGGRWYQVP